MNLVDFRLKGKALETNGFSLGDGTCFSLGADA